MPVGIEMFTKQYSQANIFFFTKPQFSGIVDLNEKEEVEEEEEMAYALPRVRKVSVKTMELSFDILKALLLP